MRPGNVVLYIESPDKSYPALVLSANQNVPEHLGDNQEPVLSLVYIPQPLDAQGHFLPPDPRLESNDWHTAVVRRGGVIHYTNGAKAGKALYDCWADLDEGWDVEALHKLRLQDAADLQAAAESLQLSPDAPPAGDLTPVAAVTSDGQGQDTAPPQQEGEVQ